MADTPFRSPYDYGHHEVSISANSRFGTVDISNNVNEIVFYESITQPYISGELMIVDVNNISNHVNFLGQERLHITMFTPENEKFIDRHFVVTGLTKQSKANDHTSVIILSFIEEHVINSELTRISKTFEGKPEVIATDVLSEINKTVRTDTSSQNQIRYIAPYTTRPLDIAMMMANRATTIDGIPFFLYASLYEDDLILESFDTMLTKAKIYNQDFIYTVSTGNTVEEDLVSGGRQIKSMSISHNEDISRLLRNNVFGSQHLWLDTNKTIPTELRQRYTETISKMPTPNGLVNYDETFMIGEKPFHEGVSEVTSSITTCSLFDGILSISEEPISDDHMKKAKANSLRLSMAKSQADIIIPGFHLMQGKQITGRTIDIFVQKNMAALEDKDATENKIMDKKLSGTYLIFSTRHQFKNTKYEASLNITKYDNKKSLSQEQVNNV